MYIIFITAIAQLMQTYQWTQVTHDREDGKMFRRTGGDNV